MHQSWFHQSPIIHAIDSLPDKVVCCLLCTTIMALHRGQVVLTAAQQVAKWTVPSFICQDNMGWANMMSRTAMVEARCARLQG
jgi:hypothetical protein